jgi:membrane-associated phospholipid phosphatase
MRQLPEVSLMMISITLSLAAVTVISTSWQISAQGTGIGGMLGAVVALLVQTSAEGLYYPMLGILITAGFLMSARLQLNAHTPKQIIAGLSLGFGISMAAVLFWF